jgi:hypothetical protein
MLGHDEDLSAPPLLLCLQVEARPYLALVQEAAPGGDLGWQVEDQAFHAGEGGSCPLVRPSLSDDA